MSINRTIFNDINPDRFVHVKLKKAPNAKIIYINYKLANQLGYSSNKLQETIQNEYGYLVDEQEDSKSEIVGYADTYNSSPLKPMKESGSGRGVFLKNGVFLKGAGLTPLAPLRGWSTKMLNTGFCPLYEGIKEAIYGEFFQQGGPVDSTQVLAVFDLGFKDDDQKNFTEQFDQGLIVRVGDHTRFAHYSEGSNIKEMQSNGKARPVNNWDEYKPKFSLTELITNHAKALAAGEFRRFWHGAMDGGNTKMRGGALDYGSATFQLDTAPRFWLNPGDFTWFSNSTKEVIMKVGTFGYEYLTIIDSLSLFYPDFKKEEFNKELHYQRLLRLMDMFGFSEVETKKFLAHSDNEEIINSFYTSWWNLGKYFYWGEMNGRKTVADTLSLIDIFGYLKNASLSFCNMQPLPEININKPAHVKDWELDSWQKDTDFEAFFHPYYVKLDSKDKMIFASEKAEKDFNLEKDLLNSKLTNVFNAFILYWQMQNENIAIKKKILKESVDKNSKPLTHLSRGPLLEKFKMAFTEYKEQGNLNAIQEFIDATVTIKPQYEEHCVEEMRDSGLKTRSGYDRFSFFRSAYDNQTVLEVNSRDNIYRF